MVTIFQNYSQGSLHFKYNCKYIFTGGDSAIQTLSSLQNYLANKQREKRMKLDRAIFECSFGSLKYINNRLGIKKCLGQGLKWNV